MIDMLVGAMIEYVMMMSFLDVFFGFNQILMHPKDHKKMAFMIGKGIYCYKVIPFGCKNA